MRDEADRIFEALDELFTIAREANIPAEIYHLKLASPNVWGRYDELIERIESAQAEGLKITADMYTYPAGSTGLDSVFPAWVKEGVRAEWLERLADPEMRNRIIREMNETSTEWENMYLNAKPEGILLVGFTNKDLDKYIGMTLAEVAAERKTSPEETAMDLVIENIDRITAVYFAQSEDVVRKLTAMPWMSFNSDAPALAAEGKFLEDSTHPRAYGSFARLLGKYVRDEKTMPLGEAIRKLAALPADNLSLKGRGYLKPGYFADIAIFNPDTIQDHATFEQPHQYSTGMKYVLVNGILVLKDGEPTDARPGRFVRGPGWKP
jgi:N-acyl-D-amino-acid deacylase